MKIIKPYYEIRSDIEENQILKNIERAGRTCYKSEESITDISAPKFIKMLIDKGHESVLEHEKVTVLFVCDRGVSHEIVRHRIASFSQESTRYCNYSKDKFKSEITFIQPLWISDEQIEFVRKLNERNFTQVEEITKEWYYSMLQSEQAYNSLIRLGWQPQQARSVLPNSLKTEIVVTANLREWRTIFKQRTSPAAHPQMRELMCPLLDHFKVLIPVVFADINY
jgi:thymidylate synthase (FAD)